MKIRIVIITALVAAALSAGAQAQTTPAKTGTPPSATALKAAEQMLVAAGIDKTFENEATGVIDQYITNVPEDKRDKFKEVMKQFVGKYCTWTYLKDDMCMIYAREFTEVELKQLTAFYTSPLGKKLNAKQPELERAGKLIGQQVVSQHQDELSKMLAEAFK